VSMSKDILGGVSTDSSDTIGTGRYSNSPPMIESITSARTTLDSKEGTGGMISIVDLLNETFNNKKFNNLIP
jgi:hypothetical protein